MSLHKTIKMLFAVLITNHEQCKSDNTEQC